jgi:hypothetical protein
MHNSATAIPNATISRWFRDLEIGREDLDKNYNTAGMGHYFFDCAPLAGKYYGLYTCKADNINGSALHEMN